MKRYNFLLIILFLFFLFSLYSNAQNFEDEKPKGKVKTSKNVKKTKENFFTNLLWGEFNNGITEEDLTAIQVDPNNSDIIYAGGKGVVYKTENGGMSWEIAFNFSGKIISLPIKEEKKIEELGIEVEEKEIEYDDIEAFDLDPSDFETLKDEPALNDALGREIETPDDLIEAIERFKEIQSEKKEQPLKKKELEEVETKSLNRVNEIFITSNSIYLGTEDGLYISSDRNNWEKIFFPFEETSRNVLSVTINPKNNEIYIGTEKGFFKSSDNGIIWNVVDGKMSSLKINSLSINPPLILAGTSEGAYLSKDNGVTWDKIFSGYVRSSLIKGENIFYIGTKKGLYYTTDGGKIWNSEPDIEKEVLKIKIDPFDNSHLYLATKESLFHSFGKGWTEIYYGLLAKNIRDFSLDKIHKGKIWLATEKGIYSTLVGLPSEKDLAKLPESVTYQRVMQLFSKDPPIQKLIESALNYNKIGTDIIDSWEKRNFYKYFLPNLKFTLVRNIGINQQFSSSDNLKFISGDLNLFLDYPDDFRQTFYTNDKWNYFVMFNWSLNEILFNKESITIQNKIDDIVKQRNKLIEKIKKLFITRRESKIDLEFNKKLSPKEKIKKRLKFEETTALLDEMTNGALSKE